MKKTISATLLSFALASTAFAATPAIDLNAGQAQIGYSYNNLQTNVAGMGDLGTFHGNGYQFAYGLSDKLALTGEYLRSDARNFTVYTNGVYSNSVTGLNFNSTALGLQYKLSDNLALSAGSLKSELNSNYGSSSSTEVFGGIAYHQHISNNMEGYASYMKSTNVQDVKAGVTYDLGSKTSLDIGYRDYQNKATGNLTTKGLSFGVNHKF